MGVIEQSLIIEERNGGTTQTTGNKSLNPYYYGGASHYTGATPIQVDAGREVNNINITLVERATYKIAGSIVAAGGPLAGAYLNLLLHDEGLGGPRSMTSWELSSQADKDGQWSFKDVPDGSYDIEVDPRAELIAERHPEDESHKTRRRFVGQRQHVVVAGADVSNVMLSLSEGGRVSGSIAVEGDKPMPRGQISLRSTTRRMRTDNGVGVQLEPARKG